MKGQQRRQRQQLLVDTGQDKLEQDWSRWADGSPSTVRTAIGETEAQSSEATRGWSTRRWQHNFLTLKQQIRLHSRAACLQRPWTFTTSCYTSDGEYLKAWQSLVARWDPKLRSKSAEADEVRNHRRLLSRARVAKLCHQQ